MEEKGIYATQNIQELEELPEEFGAHMKAYQEEIDRQQVEKLANGESPEARLLAALKEIIQNTICETCSHCG